MYRYVANALEHIVKEDAEYTSKYRGHQFEFYNNIIDVFVNTSCNADNSEKNISASFLCGATVYGRVWVGLSKCPTYNEDPPFIDLTIQRLKAIIEIRSKGISTPKEEGNVYVNLDKVMSLTVTKYREKEVLDVNAFETVLNKEV